MLDYESCQSLEKLVIDNEICGMAYRLIQGIVQRDEPIAKDLFKGIQPETQFLSLPHTKKWYRQEHTFPKIADRDTYDSWIALGKKSNAERASEEVERLLQQPPSSLLEEDLRETLQEIMLSDARNHGLSSLPELNI